MTRRGSLVYYLAAWILGCFFMVALVWFRDMVGAPVHQVLRETPAGLVFLYFYGLLCGATTALLGAFLLRRLMQQLKCKTPLHWAVGGAILSPVLIGILSALGRHTGVWQRPRLSLIGLMTLGPMVVTDAGWWLAIPGGAATAYLLCRIERAFAPRRPSA